jgi:hypothetical protein
MTQFGRIIGLLFELAPTLNTGNVRDQRTVEQFQRN